MPTYGFAGGTLLYKPPRFRDTDYRRLTKSDLDATSTDQLPLVLCIVKGPSGRLGWPGGKARPGETPAQTATREVKEEIGLTLSFDPSSDPCVSEVQLFPSPATGWRCHTGHLFARVTTDYKEFARCIGDAQTASAGKKREVLGVVALPVFFSRDTRIGLAPILQATAGGWEERIGANPLLAHPGTLPLSNQGKGWDLLVLLHRAGILEREDTQELAANPKIGLHRMDSAVEWSTFSRLVMSSLSAPASLSARDSAVAPAPARPSFH
jgi:8-oxo-dGTP pyrophosphatase MutT (NUDIX family)